MNPGVLRSSPVQQMMGAGNPNWWNINNSTTRTPPQQPSPLLPSSSSSSSVSSFSSIFPPYLPPASLAFPSCHEHNHELPESWSNLLLGGLGGEGNRCNMNQMQAKKMQNWEDGLQFCSSTAHAVDVKNEIVSESGYAPLHASWAQILPPSSCSSVTSFTTNTFEFCNSKAHGRQQQLDQSYEPHSIPIGSALKKARLQISPPQSTTFKVRKEKVGDRITALHQLVSPFGKTDTASVLLEAIGYIRFLQTQIEALSSPYLGSATSRNKRQMVPMERNCMFPEDSGQLLNRTCITKAGSLRKGDEDEPKDLKSRGLCLVPLSCTLEVGSNSTGADLIWSPPLGSGGFQ